MKHKWFKWCREGIFVKKIRSILGADRISVSVSLVDPTRGQEVQQRWLKSCEGKKFANNQELIESVLTVLRNENWVIFSATEKPHLFVQFARDERGLILDFPCAQDQVGAKRGELVGLVLERFGFKLMPKKVGWRLNWHRYEYEVREEEPWTIINAYVLENRTLAAKCALAIFTKVLALPDDFEVCFEFND